MALLKEAPDFTLPDESGRLVSLKDLLGKQCLVLFFYPKDGSPICSAEACAFRDRYHQFVDRGATVVGISSDSVDSHRQFHKQKNLPFRLLSDKSGQVSKSYGVGSWFGLIPARATFIIDKQGFIRYT